MSACTFFGHRDAPQEIEPILMSTLTDLVINKTVNMFYVGNQGGFDLLVKKCLKLIQAKNPHISYYVVLVYFPNEKNTCAIFDYADTIYPEGLEHTPPKYAISQRNRWIIDKSDYVVTYVKHSVGGAAKFKEISEKNGKTVINLPDL